MQTLILSTFISLLVLLMDLKAKCYKYAYKYIALFFLLAGIGYFSDAMKLQASEITPYYRYLRSKEEAGITLTVKNETRKKTKKELQKEYIETCWEKAHYHFEEGCKCLKEAEEISLLFPDIPDFDKAKLCQFNFIAALAPGDPTFRAITIALTLVGQYSMLFVDEWNKFKNLLLRSKSHFEMEEHYRLIGKYHYDLYFIEKEEAKKKREKD